jgi:hypothetical protein
MDGQNYVVFHNDSNDSYMNSTANFRGADVGALFIDLFFASATSDIPIGGYDKVRLTVDTGKEELALEEVGAALAGNRNPVMVVADDTTSLYVSDHISAVASISLASQAITRAPIVTWSSATELTAAQSGVTVITGDVTAGILSMPSAALAGAGWFCDVMILHTQGTAATHITTETNGGYFIGGLLIADGDSSDKSEHFMSDGDSNDWINLDTIAKGNAPGGVVRIATAFADAES